MSRLRRLGLAAYGLTEVWWGLWAYVAPSHFFANFPGLGHSWTGAYPPYNEHLVVDLGSTFLTLGALLLAAAALDDRRVTLVVVLGVALFGALHLAFHATHRGELGGDYAMSLATLVLGVALPVLVLATLRVRDR